MSDDVIETDEDEPITIHEVDNVVTLPGLTKRPASVTNQLMMTLMAQALGEYEEEYGEPCTNVFVATISPDGDGEVYWQTDGELSVSMALARLGAIFSRRSFTDEDDDDEEDDD